ncbi:acetate/propionate family kinase [Desulfohalovibrio reitneri]|uniref:acetate/propionate family kinase n=1 Tax=Desulfohalovibrio reitneri TaxID=1307759 RepID=UPI0004A700C7|nr:acetate kinase [Desulfohalovibrio reitneri]
MNVLVLNSGSSSIKFQFFAMQGGEGGAVRAKGAVERIGESSGKFEYENEKGAEFKREDAVPDHDAGLRLVMEALTHADHGVLASTDEIEAVGHRVVHGGERFHAPTSINDEVEQAIEAHIPLAPLHNPPNLTGIRTARKLIPNAEQVAVFDTAFHQTMPPHAYMYAFPYELYEQAGVRRYGFHGTSHAYVSRELCKLMGREVEDVNLISAHLGNGASMAAVAGGRCVDTSLGMTPLAGLIMGTRTGDFDPAILFYLARERGYSLEEMDQLVNKESGLKGICGSNDLRDVHDKAASGDERAALALEMLAYRNRKYFGGYFAALGRVDAIVFTAGVGENDDRVRELSLQGLSGLGVHVDPERNQAGGGRFKAPGRISTDDSPVQVWVVPTNEELEIARQTYTALRA